MKLFGVRRAVWMVISISILALPALAQNMRTNCDAGAGPLQPAPPKDPIEGIIQKFAAAESRLKAEIANYSYVQDITVQTLNGDTVNGEF